MKRIRPILPGAAAIDRIGMLASELFPQSRTIPNQPSPPCQPMDPAEVPEEMPGQPFMRKVFDPDMLPDDGATI